MFAKLNENTPFATAGAYVTPRAQTISTEEKTTPFQEEWASLSKMISEADLDLQRFEEKKATLDKKLTSVTVAVEDLSSDIQDCIKSEANPNGVLTGKLSDYIKCIAIDYESLISMYKADKSHWQGRVDDIRHEEGKIAANCKSSFEAFDKRGLQISTIDINDTNVGQEEESKEEQND